MPELPKYHLNPQRADALLQPLALSLHELAARTEHYLDRLVLSDEDRAALATAHATLTDAHATLDRLWQARLSQPHS